MKANAVLTKSELVEDIAAARHLLRRDAEFAVNAVFDSIVRSLEPGCSQIELRGFGASSFAIERLTAEVFSGAPVARAHGLHAVEAEASI